MGQVSVWGRFQVAELEKTQCCCRVQQRRRLKAAAGGKAPLCVSTQRAGGVGGMAGTAWFDYEYLFDYFDCDDGSGHVIDYEYDAGFSLADKVCRLAIAATRDLHATAVPRDTHAPTLSN